MAKILVCMNSPIALHTVRCRMSCRMERSTWGWNSFVLSNLMAPKAEKMETTSCWDVTSGAWFCPLLRATLYYRRLHDPFRSCTQGDDAFPVRSAAPVANTSYYKTLLRQDRENTERGREIASAKSEKGLVLWTSKRRWAPGMGTRPGPIRGSVWLASGRDHRPWLSPGTPLFQGTG